MPDILPMPSMKDFVYNGQPSRVVFGAGSLAHLVLKSSNSASHVTKPR